MKFLLVILALAIIAFVVYKVVKSKSRKPNKVQASVYSQPHTYTGSAYTSRNIVTKPTMSPSREAQLGGRIERKPVTRTKPVVEKPRKRSEDSSDDYVAISEPADFGYWGSDSGYSEPDRSSSYEAPTSSYDSGSSSSSYDSGSSSSYSSDSSGSSSSSSSDSGSSSSSSDY